MKNRKQPLRSCVDATKKRRELQVVGGHAVLVEDDLDLCPLEEAVSDQMSVLLEGCLPGPWKTVLISPREILLALSHRVAHVIVGGSVTE